MSSTDLFLEWFKEYYSHEYPEISQECKDHWIEEILLNNSKYLDKSIVLNFDGCIMCGRCCINQRCPHVTEDGKCDRHDDPIDQLCLDYPWTGDDFGIAPLTLNCRYQVSFFVNWFNTFFEEMVEDEKDEAMRLTMIQSALNGADSLE